MNTLKITAVLLLILLSEPSHAYKEPTHGAMSVSAYNRSILSTNNDLLIELGATTESDPNLQVFPHPRQLGELTRVRDLINDGSIYEDEFPRSLSHFYNPIINAGLSQGDTSPDWALEDNGDIDPVKNGHQHYSYKDALEYYRLALTSETKAARDDSWGELFYALGHIIHHLQDMAQPEHARNDAHCDFPPCALLGQYDKSYYESYTDELRSGGEPIFDSLLNGGAHPIPSYDKAREFWTTQDSDSGIVDRRGMGDFTNRNFVSKDTMFQINNGVIKPHHPTDLPQPVPNLTPNTMDISHPDLLGAAGTNLCDQIKANAIISLPPSACYIDFVTSSITGSESGEPATNDRSATYSIFDKYLQQHNIDAIYTREDGSIDTIDRSLTLNEFNYRNAHKYLIPRAVAYSAGLINHFFMIKLELYPNATGAGWVVKNNSNYDIEGSFTVFYDVDGVRSAVPGADWVLSVQMNSELNLPVMSVPAEWTNLVLVFDGNKRSSTGGLIDERVLSVSAYNIADEMLVYSDHLERNNGQYDILLSHSIIFKEIDWARNITLGAYSPTIAGSFESSPTTHNRCELTFNNYPIVEKKGSNLHVHMVNGIITEINGSSITCNGYVSIGLITNLAEIVAITTPSTLTENVFITHNPYFKTTHNWQSKYPHTPNREFVRSNPFGNADTSSIYRKYISGESLIESQQLTWRLPADQTDIDALIVPLGWCSQGNNTPPSQCYYATDGALHESIYNSSDFSLFDATVNILKNYSSTP